ncbi:MAG: HAD-IIIA family hydrolase [Eubacterium sp.]|nr:HAD-IIIA family hydrolase [Eubacterium sp.]
MRWRYILKTEKNYTKKPKMVLFDYGQTLIAEQNFDGVKGTKAVLRYATKNKYHLSAEQVQAKADEINREFGRFDPKKRHLFQMEIPNTMFTPYLYESQGIEIALNNSEIDTVFCNAAAPGIPTEGIKDFLRYLKNKGIRTGVISNISYAPSVVAERINRLLPENTFEFIITSSNFMFRKPNKRIFDLALEKAELQPDEVWYIGDQYECDVKGSLNAGMMLVWYIGAMDLPYAEDKNILTINTWSELERYMEV